MGEGHEVEIMEFVAASIEIAADDTVKSFSRMTAAALASSSSAMRCEYNNASCEMVAHCTLR